LKGIEEWLDSFEQLDFLEDRIGAFAEGNFQDLKI